VPFCILVIVIALFAVSHVVQDHEINDFHPTHLPWRSSIFALQATGPSMTSNVRLQTKRAVEAATATATATATASMHEAQKRGNGTHQERPHASRSSSTCLINQSLQCPSQRKGMHAP
jgi:hypothetical protein